MSDLVVYHVALDCSIDNFNKSPENIIFGTYGDMGNYIGTNVPVVFSLEDAHQTGIKLINHVLKYGPLCKKIDNYGNVYMFPVRGYIIIKYIYNGSTYNFSYQNDLKDNYTTLASVINNNNLVTFTVNGIQRGVINRNYFNNYMSNPQIYVVDEPRISGIYNYMAQYGPAQMGLLQAYPTLAVPSIYHHTNHHHKHHTNHHRHHKNHESSSSYSPSKNRYSKYQMNGGEYDDDDEFDAMYEEKYLKYKQKYLDLKNDD
jgi:hypothetical protein